MLNTIPETWKILVAEDEIIPDEVPLIVPIVLLTLKFDLHAFFSGCSQIETCDHNVTKVIFWGEEPLKLVCKRCEKYLGRYKLIES